MSIEASIINTTPQSGQGSANQNNAANGDGTTGAGSLSANFLDFIFVQLNQLDKNFDPNAQDGSLSGGEDGTLQSSNPLFDRETKLEIAKILAANSDIAQDIQNYSDNLSLEEGDIITDTIALNQKAFDDILKPVLNPDQLAEIEGLLAGGSDQQLKIGAGADDTLGHDYYDSLLTTTGLTTTQDFLSNISEENLSFFEGLSADRAERFNAAQAILAKLNDVSGGSNPSLIAQNLTPEQLFDIRQKLNEILNTPPSERDEDLPPLAGLFSGVIQISAPRDQNAQKQINDALYGNAAIAAANLSAKTSEFDFASRLNNLNVGGGADVDNKLNRTGTPYSTNGYEGTFEDALRGIDGDIGELTRTAARGQNGEAPALNIQSAKADASAITTLPFPALDGVFASSSSIGVGSEYAALSPTQPVTGLSTLADLTTQAQTAARAHPATQAVAATLQRSVSKGGDQNIILRLDPAELGRVEVRLQFTKEKTLKASVIAEKPETHLLLQRDSHALEQALEDAGLDSENGLTFDLAEDGYDFDHNGSHDGSNGGAGGGENGEDEEIIIESSVDWHVDPRTGHISYNILA